MEEKLTMFDAATTTIEDAIRKFNDCGYPAQIRIVWGEANAELKQFAEECHQKSALLNIGNEDYELSFSQSGDPDFPGVYCHLYLALSSVVHLPRDARGLYNVLKCCEYAVKLDIFPNEGEIAVHSVETTIAAESITGKSFFDALQRLSVSASAIYDLIVNNSFDDSWKMDAHCSEDD